MGSQGSVILSLVLIISINAVINPVYSEKAIEPIIQFDKTEYAPSDLVGIEITYPPANTNPKKSDTIKARVFTSSGISQGLLFGEVNPVSGQYKYYEYHTDTGIFHSYVQLTPDPDKWWGELKVQRGDELTIEFKTEDGRTFTKKVDINFNLGGLRFSKDAFSTTEKMEIMVWDLDRNSKPNTIETLPVWIWSTTDPRRIMVTLKETNENSGEFRAIITLATHDTSSGARLRVSDGDTVTARYVDNTRLPTGKVSPKGFEMFAVREVFTSALVMGPCALCPPLERMGMDEPHIFKRADEVAVSVTQLDAGDTAIIRTEITNIRNMSQQFAYITQVKNSENVVVSLSWVRGQLRANETMKAESTWIPASPDTYMIELFLWTDIDNPVALSPVRTSEVKVKKTF
ncbi:MAG: hypothetical protein QXU32_13320 [Nitrososphaerales archaeon]